MKTRFAASSAPLRVGRARLALVAWLAAKQAGAAFVLRLSTPDPPPELAWLGVQVDATLHLAERAEAHAEAVTRLREAGRLYPCFETEDELRWKREQRIRRHQPPVYDRAMLKLTAAQRATAEAGGKRPYWRFLLSDAEVRWRDRVAGPQAVKLQAISDPVVVASDGRASAALVAAIEDREAEIALVVRDTVQLESSGVHLDIFAALGGRPERLAFAHLASLPEEVAALTLRRLRQDGVEPAALATLLAAPSSALPRLALDLVAGFDLAATGQGVRAADMGRLRALNRISLGALPFAAVAQRLPQGADERFWLALRGGIDLLSEARPWWDVVSGAFVPPVLDGAAPILARAMRSLPAEPWDHDTWRRWTADMADTALLRLALTGEETGPDMSAMLPLIGRARSAERLRLA